MRHTKVKDLLNSKKTLHEVNAKGWVRTFRNNQFIALNDGSLIIFNVLSILRTRQTKEENYNWSSNICNRNFGRK
jgi:asparaginyl-tRNA synthetase